MYTISFNLISLLIITCLKLIHSTDLIDKQSSNENVIIDIKVQIPKNSLLNLVLKASSSNNVECLNCSKKALNEQQQILINKNYIPVSLNHQSSIEYLESTKNYSSFKINNKTELELETTRIPKKVRLSTLLINFCGFNNANHTKINETKFNLATITIPAQQYVFLNLTSTTTSITNKFNKSTTQQSILPITNNNNNNNNVINSCPSNFNNYENKCIFISEIHANWPSAKKFCETLNSSLIIPDFDLKFYILLEIANKTKEDFWVNAFYHIQFDDWVHPTVKFENKSNNAENDHLIYIDLDHNKNWLCDLNGLKQYSELNLNLLNANILAMTYSSSMMQYCLMNFNLNEEKLFACELNQ